MRPEEEGDYSCKQEPDTGTKEGEGDRHPNSEEVGQDYHTSEPEGKCQGDPRENGEWAKHEEQRLPGHQPPGTDTHVRAAEAIGHPEGTGELKDPEPNFGGREKGVSPKPGGETPSADTNGSGSLCGKPCYRPVETQGNPGVELREEGDPALAQTKGERLQENERSPGTTDRGELRGEHNEPRSRHQAQQLQKIKDRENPWN